MKVTQALKTEVHNVLVQMAIDGDLDGDINNIDIDEVFDKAVANMKENKETSFFSQSHEVESLDEYILPDDDEGETLRSCYNRLKEEQAKGNGDENIDNYVTPVQRYEYTFTINELLELIEL